MSGPPLDYEVQPDRIIQRKRSQVGTYFAYGCAVILAAYSIVIALFLWRW